MQNNKSRYMAYLRLPLVIVSIVLLLFFYNDISLAGKTLLIGFISFNIFIDIEKLFSRVKVKKFNSIFPVVLKSLAHFAVLTAVLYLILTELKLVGKIGDFSQRDFAFTGLINLCLPVLGIAIFLINLFIHIDKMLGKGALINLLTSKYSHPKIEKKFFLFIDLNSSTHIAEVLGIEQYSKFLKEFFSDLTNPLIETNGKVFQYCGDEAIITWDEEEGISNNNILRFYYLVKKSIEVKSEKYSAEFGMVPKFKVGIHFGDILVTEVGEVKKEIVYHGDIINSTSRIRSKCSELKKEVLISDEVYKRVKNCKKYNFRDMGCIEFKGKEKKIKLYSVEENDS